MESQETVSHTVNRYGESFKQESILLHARPIRRLQGLCPKCGKPCSGYDRKRSAESRWRAPNLNGLPVHIAEAAIREAGAMENMKTLIISGGEPWLLFEEVVEYASLASSLGLSVTLYSNGFWGKDASAAHKAVRQMKEAGVGCVSFSADRYH